MSTAQRLFVGYATVILVVGFTLGTVLGMARMNAPAARNLAAAHVETLMQAAMHLGLAFAFGAVGFDSTTATWAALLTLAGSAMQATGATLNWAMKTTDQFAQRSPGFMINSASTFVAWPGLALAAWGVLSRL